MVKCGEDTLFPVKQGNIFLEGWLMIRLRFIYRHKLMGLPYN